MLRNTPTINGFVDAKTEKSALNFWIDTIAWKSDARVEATGGGAAAMGSGNGGTFSIVWNKNRWIVTDYKMREVF